MNENWVVVTTHNRHAMLDDLLSDLPRAQTVIVDHRSDPPIEHSEVARVIRCDCDPNISHLWNLGINWVAGHARGTPYTVTVINDDLRVPPGTLPSLASALHRTNTQIAFPDVHGLLKPGEIAVRQGEPGPHNLFHRMTGYCFMLRGDGDLRADESLVWWYGDDDLEWRAEARLGTVRVGGAKVEHLSPNASMADPALAAQAVRDRDTFIAKWGVPPW